MHRVCGDYIRQTLLAACRRPFSHLTTGIKPACAVRSLPPWLIWMFFAVVLADLALPLFFMEMVISQNVNSDVNYLIILAFPCLIVI